MDWAINIPHFGDLDAPASEIGRAAAYMGDEDERAIAKAAAMEAILAGIPTVRDVINAIERRPIEERRVLVDSWREQVGLEKIAEIERRREQRRIDRRFEQADPPLPPSQRDPGPSRDAQGKAFQECHERSCSTYPVGAAGQPIPVKARRWWCPVHRGQAGEHDMEDWTPPRITTRAASNRS